MRTARIVGVGLTAALLPGTAQTQQNEPPQSISSEHLIHILQTLNNEAFATKGSATMKVSELPGVHDGTPEAESATIEHERVAAMAHRIATAGPELTVANTSMTIHETREVPAGRIVTMHTVRTLSEGTSWEELEPFLVIDKQGFPLEPGSYRYLNAEEDEDWSEFTGEAKEQAETPEHEGTPESDTGMTASTKPLSWEEEALYAKQSAAVPMNGDTADRAKVKNYARKYALNPNPAYHEYPNDCTSFASQALRAGGWGDKTGFYRSDSVWWYTGIWPIRASWTWAGAENWYKFARNESKRVTALDNVYKLREGDILQYKLKNSDGNMDHTMVVTGRTKNGVPLLSYHTRNRLDVPFTAILSKDLTWFAHAVK